MASVPAMGSTGDSASQRRIDHALALLLADEPEVALQWAAAVVDHDPAMASALLVTCRSLEQLGRARAASDGLSQAVERAIDDGNLALALAAIAELRRLGADVDSQLQRVASSFCQGSSRLTGVSEPPPPADDFQPLSPFLSGPALASKATEILQSAGRTRESGLDGSREGASTRPLSPLPLFSALSMDSLGELLTVFEAITVPVGHCLVKQGDTAIAAYLVAWGELEVSRSGGEGKPPMVLGRLGAGAFFGETELLSELPHTCNLIAVRPSIVLLAKREALEVIARRRPDVGVELAAHSRRQLLANLGRGSALLNDVPQPVRAKLLEKLETRVFQKGEKILREGQEAPGLHLIVSGETVVVAHEGREPVLLATLGPGETIGEVELILCRRAGSDAIAAHPTTTLFLPRHAFLSLIREEPSLLPGMYMAAVRRHAETNLALEGACVVVTDGYLLDDAAGAPPQPPTMTESERPLPWKGDPGDHPSGIPGESEVAAELAAQIELSSLAGAPTYALREVHPFSSRPASAPSSVMPTSASLPPPRASHARRSGMIGSWLAASTGASLLAAAIAIGVVTIRDKLAGPSRASRAAAHGVAGVAATTATAVETRSTEKDVPPSFTPSESNSKSSPSRVPTRPSSVEALHPRAAPPNRLAAPVRPPPPAASETPPSPESSSMARTGPAPSSSAEFGGRN